MQTISRHRPVISGGFNCYYKRKPAGGVVKVSSFSVFTFWLAALGYDYDDANRLTIRNGVPRCTWDDDGNLLSDGTQTYAYDQANRLRTVVQGATTTTFAYNGVGERLSQSVGVTTTHYVLDPAAGLTQVLSDGTNTYLYGNERLAQYQAGMQYFGTDGLGSVRQIFDASATVVGSSRYDPYGKS